MKKYETKGKLIDKVCKLCLIEKDTEDYNIVARTNKKDLKEILKVYPTLYHNDAEREEMLEYQDLARDL